MVSPGDKVDAMKGCIYKPIYKMKHGNYQRERRRWPSELKPRVIRVRDGKVPRSKEFCSILLVISVFKLQQRIPARLYIFSSLQWHLSIDLRGVQQAAGGLRQEYEQMVRRISIPPVDMDIRAVMC